LGRLHQAGGFVYKTARWEQDMLLCRGSVNEEANMRTSAKPIIKVYLLPNEWSEAEYQDCFDALLKGAQSLDPLGVRTENDFIVLFPKDGMRKGLGTEIVIEVDIPNIHSNYDCNRKMVNGEFFGTNKIANTFFEIMHGLLPAAYIQCKVYEYHLEGFCMSPRDIPVSEEQILAVLHDHKGRALMATDIVDDLWKRHEIRADLSAVVVVLEKLEIGGVVVTVNLQAPPPFTSKQGWKLS